MSGESLKEDVFMSVKEILSEIIGEDELDIIGVGMDSVFYTDLMIDSLKFVYLADKVEKLYGDKVDVYGWLSYKSPRQIVAITVGDLVGLIADGLAVHYSGRRAAK